MLHGVESGGAFDAAVHPFGPQVAEAIADGLRALHRQEFREESGGELHVVLHDRFVTVFREVDLSRAERALVASGNGGVVRESREVYADLSGDRYRQVVERATGRSVDGFASRLSLDGSEPWSADVFVLAAA